MPHITNGYPYPKRRMTKEVRDKVQEGEEEEEREKEEKEEEEEEDGNTRDPLISPTEAESHPHESRPPAKTPALPPPDNLPIGIQARSLPQHPKAQAWLRCWISSSRK